MYLAHPTPIKFDSLTDLCNARLSLLFPAGVPSFAENRLCAELAKVANVHAENEFLLFHQLSLAAHASGNTIQVTSTRVAGSFLEYLLGNGLENPLPAYYYCSKCGYFELGDAVFGIDLPEKRCPHCTENLLRDGFGIPIEAVFGTVDGLYPQLHYELSNPFFPLAFETASAFYHQLNLQTVPLFTTDRVQPYMVGFAGLTSHDFQVSTSPFPGYPDGIDCTDPSFEDDLIVSNSKYAFVYGGLDFSFSDVPLHKFCCASPKDIADQIWDSCLNVKEEECVSSFAPTSFLEIVKAFCLSKLIYEENDVSHELEDLLQNETLMKYRIFCVEDLYETLPKLGINKTDALKWTAIVRKGRASAGPNSIKALSLPSDLEELLLCIRHLPHRIFGVRRLIAFMRMFYLEESTLPLRKSTM